MKATVRKGELREVLRIVRQAKHAETLQRCVLAAAALAGVEWQAIMRAGRGAPTAARARVVAMHAAVCLGVPIATTARGFRRCRRSVHKALEIGQPGRESRDEAVLSGMRAVVSRVSSNDQTLPPQ